MPVVAVICDSEAKETCMCELFHSRFFCIPCFTMCSLYAMRSRDRCKCLRQTLSLPSHCTVEKEDIPRLGFDLSLLEPLSKLFGRGTGMVRRFFIFHVCRPGTFEGALTIGLQDSHQGLPARSVCDLDRLGLIVLSGHFTEEFLFIL